MIKNLAKLPEGLLEAINPKSTNYKAEAHKKLIVPEGNRHNFMVSLAGYYRWKGYNEDQIFCLLSSASEVSFKNPLVELEVSNIARGCAGYDSFYDKVTVNLDDIVEGPIESVISPYISRYDTNILEGEPGSGKSTLLGEIAACITTGKDFCGITPDVTGDVLFFAIEDNPSTVFKTRARLQGADFKRIDLVNTFLALDDEGFDYLEEALSRKNYALVIIDTLTASLAGMKMNDGGDMSKLLRKLTDIGRTHKTTFLVVRHFRKAGAENAGHIGMGSIAITGGARSSMMLKQCTENENKRYFAHNKSNGLKKGKTLTFIIQDAPNENTEIGKLTWTGTSDLTSDDLLCMKKKQETELDRAKTFIRKILSNGSVKSKVIEEEALDNEISMKTLNRAKAELKIKPKKVGKAWEWKLS